VNNESRYLDLERDISEIVYTREQILNRVGEIGEAISSDYAGKNLLLVGVLKGVMIFMADLLRSITIPVAVDFMAISSYSSEARDKGLVRLVKDLEIPIQDRDVLFVEDVVDTGLTLNYLLQNLRTRSPATLEVCTLFNKPRHRLIEIPLKYVGFDLPDRFIVGYGLDYRERYRNLPYVGLLKAGVLQSSSED
jgi:hypoxanthine phosphoribosyltransferase